MIQRLLKDSIIYGIAGTASRFVSVLLLPLYTRVFSPDQYGLLDLLVTASSILVLLSGMEVGSGVGRSYFEARKTGRNQILVGTGLLLNLIGVSVFALASALGFHLWLYGYGGITWMHVMPLLLALLPSQFLAYQCLILRLERRSYLFTLVSVGDIVTSATLNVIAVLILRWGIPGVMWGLFISKFVWALVAIIVLRKHLRLCWQGDYVREILTYSIPTMPNVLVSWVQNYANRFILLATLTLFQVGIFSLAVKIASGAVLLIYTAFRTAWYPYAMEIMREPGAAQKYARMLDLYLLGMLCLSALVGVLGDLAVRILAAEAYLRAGRLIGFIAMGLLWNGSLEIIVLGIDVVRKTYLGLIGLILGALINVLVLAITATWWGVVAACIAYLLGAYVTAMVSLAISQQQYRIPYRYYIIALVSALSWLLPFFFYYTPEPAGLTELALTMGLRTLLTIGLCIICVVLVLDRADRLKLLRVFPVFLWVIFGPFQSSGRNAVRILSRRCSSSRTP